MRGSNCAFKMSKRCLLFSCLFLLFRTTIISADVNSQSIEVVLVADKQVYSHNEAIKFLLRIKNLSPQSISFYFGNLWVELNDLSKSEKIYIIWKPRKPHLLTMNIIVNEHFVTMEPQEERLWVLSSADSTTKETLNGKEENVIAPFPSGNYVARYSIGSEKEREWGVDAPGLLLKKITSNVLSISIKKNFLSQDSSEIIVAENKILNGARNFLVILQRENNGFSNFRYRIYLVDEMTNKVLQTLNIRNGVEIKEDGFEIVDFNADGLNDLRLIGGQDVQGKKWYKSWTFNPKDNHLHWVN